MGLEAESGRDVRPLEHARQLLSERRFHASSSPSLQRSQRRPRSSSRVPRGAHKPHRLHPGISTGEQASWAVRCPRRLPRSSRTREWRQRSTPTTSHSRGGTATRSRSAQMIPDMGISLHEPQRSRGFDVTKPPILVYEHPRRAVAAWCASSGCSRRKHPKGPLCRVRGTAGFAAACHYVDGTFVPAASQRACPSSRVRGRGSRSTFWHPDLVTLHVPWLWYPTRGGVSPAMNPLAKPFNKG